MIGIAVSDFFSAEWLIMDYLRLLRRRFDKLDWSNQQADVAQLVEQPIRNRQVSGSSPLVGSRFLTAYHHLSVHPVLERTL